MVQRGETAAGMQERRGLHGKTSEKGASPGRKQSGTEKEEISPDSFEHLLLSSFTMHYLLYCLKQFVKSEIQM